MTKAHILVSGEIAGVLENLNNGQYRFHYQPDYAGPPVSLTMPVRTTAYEFNKFPPFFEGLLPEGILLEALLRKYKIDRHDYFKQLLIVGHDVVGAVTIEETS
ncbi:MAG: HipA N-terminal domain-containing protein [Gammaproteobacteria bacterium]|nr:HipA N-terminal domain-containing protein [Gammaproteobacteria bacterium]